MTSSMLSHVTAVTSSPFQELDNNLQLLLGTKVAVYLMTFLIVTVAWAAHIRWKKKTIFILIICHYTCSFSTLSCSCSCPAICYPLLPKVTCCSSRLTRSCSCCRLFQVIVRIDDTIALLNLVSRTTLCMTPT